MATTPAAKTTAMDEINEIEKQIVSLNLTLTISNAEKYRADVFLTSKLWRLKALYKLETSNAN